MSENTKSKILSSPWAWCATTYYSEGFPYGILRSVTPLFLRAVGASLPTIGLTSLFGIPWTIKFLWGPQVDAFGTKRQWLVSFDGILSFVFFVAALALLFGRSPAWVILIFFIGAFAAATHDIAIDGYYMAALDKQGQARFVGYRTMAFRLAWMTTTGVIVAIGNGWSWFWAFFISALVMLLLFVFHNLFLPEGETVNRSLSSLLKNALSARSFRVASFTLFLLIVLFLAFPTALPRETLFSYFTSRQFPLHIALSLLAILIATFLLRHRILGHLARQPDSFYGRAFLTFMDQPKIGVMLAFIILVRAGEWLQTNMVPPFMVDLGLKKQYAWISSGVSIPASVVGALVGGWLIARFGIKKTIWPFLLLQNGANLIYMAVALSMKHYLMLNTGNPIPTPLPLGNLLMIVGVNGFDQFSSGLGNAILTMVIIRTCKPEFKAAHYAIGAGLMSMTSIIAGLASGVLAEKIGYGFFFGVTFLAALPAMLLIFFLPRD